MNNLTRMMVKPLTIRSQAKQLNAACKYKAMLINRNWCVMAAIDKQLRIMKIEQQCTYFFALILCEALSSSDK